MASRSPSGRKRNQCTLPATVRSTSFAPSSTFRCLEIVGCADRKWRPSSPAFRALPLASSCNIARRLTASGVADGPFVEAKEVVGGYMIVSAESLEHAVEVVRACPPAQMPGKSLEIRELAGGKM